MLKVICLTTLLASAALADVVTDWNDVALNAIRASNTSPPAAARTLAILHVAIFDSANGINPRYKPYYVKDTAPRGASVEAAVSASARKILLALYPALQSTIEEQYQKAVGSNREGDVDAGVRWGEFVASAILELRANDGSTNTVTHTPGTQPGQWRPTPSFGGVVRPALAPGWGTVRPFALTGGAQFRPPAPLSLTSPEYAQEVNYLKTIGGATSSTRTPEQTQIAQFWGYGPSTATPPGHWNQIAREVTRADRRGSVVESARLFALINVAMADAAIVSWDCKYYFNFWRPITAIQEADSDDNPATTSDRSWVPLLPTPPFPEYTSGHSTFSGAASVVLAYVLGSDKVRFSIGSDDLPGVQRTYRSFSEAALESGISRIYGGIHFPSANVHGLSTGGAVGLFVVWNTMRPLEGPAADAVTSAGQ